MSPALSRASGSSGCAASYTLLRTGTCSFLLAESRESLPLETSALSFPPFSPLFPGASHERTAPQSVPLFACRPRPKKEKALRNYRIAKRQRQRREERATRRHQEVEVSRAKQQLISPSKSLEGPKTTDLSVRGGWKESLFGTDGTSVAAEEAALSLPPVLRGHLAARINYRLVGGTWRRARGAGRFVRLPGAQMAATIFANLPKEELEAAISHAKQQDAGHMNLEAYDESDAAQLPTLEGIS